MEKGKDQYQHYSIKGLIAEDMIACTKETTKKTTLKYTEILDDTTCPSCITTITKESTQHLERLDRRDRRRQQNR